MRPLVWHVGLGGKLHRMENVIADPAPGLRPFLHQADEVVDMYVVVADEGDRNFGRGVHGDGLVQRIWGDYGVGIIVGGWWVVCDF